MKLIDPDQQVQVTLTSKISDIPGLCSKNLLQSTDVLNEALRNLSNLSQRLVTCKYDESDKLKTWMKSIQSVESEVVRAMLRVTDILAIVQGLVSMKENLDQENKIEALAAVDTQSPVPTSTQDVTGSSNV